MTSIKSMNKAELLALVEAQKDSLAEVNGVVEELKQANSMLEQTAAIANDAALSYGSINHRPSHGGVLRSRHLIDNHRGTRQVVMTDRTEF